MLQTDDNFDLLLIQELWVSTVATLQSDTDPDGTPQLGATLNNKWDTHLPRHSPSDTVKALAYSRRALGDSHIVTNNTSHPLSSPNSVVIDVMEHGEILMRLVNVYHAIGHDSHALRHTLQYLFNHPLNERVPTLLLGDFNTHSPRWSMPGRSPSNWARAFCMWLNDNGLKLQNLGLTPT